MRDQIGYCGLWCGSCAVGNGTISELAGRLEKLAKDYGIEEWGPSDVKYPELHGNLVSIHTVPPCPGCLKGGGRSSCEMKACAKKRHLRECSDCRSFEDCKHTRTLHHMRSGALGVGMIVKVAKGSRPEFIRKAETELKNCSPCQVLFLE